MAGWHHWLDGCESEWTPGVCDGQGCLACCDSWGCKESDTTEWLIWSDHILLDFICLYIVEGFSVYIHKTHWFVVSFILFDIFIGFCYHVILVSGVPSPSIFGQLCEKLLLIFFFSVWYNSKVKLSGNTHNTYDGALKDVLHFSEVLLIFLHSSFSRLHNLYQYIHFQVCLFFLMPVHVHYWDSLITFFFIFVTVIS